MDYINVHTHHDHWSKTIFSIYQCTVEDDFLERPFSISIHPWDIHLYSRFIQIINFSKSEFCIAIGETGLDKLKPNFKDQERLFIKHINLATQLNKPLIIHCVKAYDECIYHLKNENFKGGVLFHGFNKSKELAQQLIKNGYFISLGASFLKENHNFDRFLFDTGFQNVLLETDNDRNLSILDLYNKAQLICSDLNTKQIFINTFNNWRNYE